MKFTTRAIAAFGLAAALAVPAGTAFAEDGAASGGWGFNPYVGAGIGYSMTDESSTSGGVTVTIDDEVVSWNVLAGVKFNDYVAVEAFYKDFGDHDLGGSVVVLPGFVIPVNAGEIGFDSFGLSVVGSVPLNDTFSIFAKTGVHFWDAEANSIAFSADGTDWHVGAGLDVALSENLIIRGEYGYYEFDEIDIQDLTASLVFVF